VLSAIGYFDALGTSAGLGWWRGGGDVETPMAVEIWFEGIVNRNIAEKQLITQSKTTSRDNKTT